MPTGNYIRIKEIPDATAFLNSVVNDSFFGFVLVDIETPENLKTKFADFPPIFKNTTVTLDDLGLTAKKLLNFRGIKEYKVQKLISSYFGKRIFLFSPLLRWYLQHGLVVSRVYEAVSYKSEKCFDKFVTEVIEGRQLADKNPAHQIIGETMKLFGNCGYSRTLLRKEKFNKVHYYSSNDNRVIEKMLNRSFKDINSIGEDTIEILNAKEKIKCDQPLQIGLAVYGYAKLRMLEFYYDFLLYFIDSKKIEILHVDTDSFYLALVSNSLDSCVREDKIEEYNRIASNWFVRSDNDRRTPGLFKIEFEGNSAIEIGPKTYVVSGNSDSRIKSCGISQTQTKIEQKTFEDAYFGEISSKHKQFRFQKNKSGGVETIETNINGFTLMNDKRVLCPDLRTTMPLEI